MSKKNFMSQITGNDVAKSNSAKKSKPVVEAEVVYSYSSDEEEELELLNKELAELNQHAIKAKSLLDQAKQAGLSDTFVASAQAELKEYNSKIESTKKKIAKIEADAKKRAEEEAAAEPSVDLDLFRTPDESDLPPANTGKITIGDIIAAMEADPTIKTAVKAYLAASK